MQDAGIKMKDQSVSLNLKPGTLNSELGTGPSLTLNDEPGTRNQPFVHLNVHSHYSRGWGLPTLEELCLAAKANGMEYLALTDTNGLYGAVFFIQAAREAGLKPILGCELVHEKTRAVLLVKNEQGYANLSRMVSDLHCDQEFDLIPALRKSREGLIVLSDDERLLKNLKQKGTEDLFCEVSPGYGMARAYAFSRTSGIPPVATNRVYLLRKEDFPLHRILRAVSLNTKLSRLTPEELCRESSFFTSASEMIGLFPPCPGRDPKHRPDRGGLLHGMGPGPGRLSLLRGDERQPGL